jgi:hypothetical protein
MNLLAWYFVIGIVFVLIFDTVFYVYRKHIPTFNLKSALYATAALFFAWPLCLVILVYLIIKKVIDIRRVENS